MKGFVQVKQVPGGYVVSIPNVLGIGLHDQYRLDEAQKDELMRRLPAGSSVGWLVQMVLGVFVLGAIFFGLVTWVFDLDLAAMTPVQRIAPMVGITLATAVCLTSYFNLRLRHARDFLRRMPRASEGISVWERLVATQNSYSARFHRNFAILDLVLCAFFLFDLTQLVAEGTSVLAIVAAIAMPLIFGGMAIMHFRFARKRAEAEKAMAG